jgi:hypothetical protein
MKLHKLQNQEAVLQQREAGSRISPRKARVRLLIQAGGLVKLAGLFDVCGIEDGDDLQVDLSALDKAAALLGILMEALPHDQQLDQAQLTRCQEIGARKLKMQGARRRY